MKRNKKILFMPFFMLFNDSLLMKIETFFAGLLMIYLIFYYYVDDSGQFFFLLLCLLVSWYSFIISDWFDLPIILILLTSISWKGFLCATYNLAEILNFPTSFWKCYKTMWGGHKNWNPSTLFFFGSKGDKILFILNNFIILI